MSSPSAPSDCLQCGACCFSTSETYVRVSGDDWSRLGDRAEEFAHFVDHRAYLKMKDGHCAALVIRPRAEDPARREYFCTIYEHRPQICRDLARGSPECLGELSRKTGAVSL